jgi:hypothetical protein
MAQKPTRKPTDMVQLKLRFSEALRRRLAREAKRRNCSLNTEIVARLDESLASQSLHQRGSLSTITARALLAGLDETVVNELVALFIRERAEQLAPEEGMAQSSERVVRAILKL